MSHDSALSIGSIILPPLYSIFLETPSVDDYLRLRKDAGLTPRSASAAIMGLPNSLCAIVVRYENNVVGMGRVIGDGALFIHVVDVAIDPRHQSKGLGKAIMTTLLDWVAKNVPAEVYVSLMANGDAYKLYEKLGFSSVMPEARGMAAWLGK